MVIALITIAVWIIAVVLLLCILGEIQRTKRELEQLEDASTDMIDRGPPAPEAPRQWLN
jgi:hypothetical protein